MEADGFKHIRKKLNKTQKQMSQLLGTSVKAIHSYEQKWRSIPGHVERQVLFMIFMVDKNRENKKNCWDYRNCPEDRMHECPSWEFRAGKLCWMINGTHCEGEIQDNWKKKMQLCRSCDVFKYLLDDYIPDVD